MFLHHRIVVVIPYGRKRYTEILLEYLKREFDIIDEVRMWVNTLNQEDLEWVRSIKSDKVTLDEREILPHRGTSFAIHKFFDRCTDEGTIYIRLDDDIVYLHKDFIRKLAEFRILNKDYFLVYANIVNNAYIDWIHQFIDAIPNLGIRKECMCPDGWGNPSIAENKHNLFLSNNRKKYLFKKWLVHNFERVSINCISWSGEEFAKFQGAVQEDEELWLSVEKPRGLNKINVICGEALCVHFAFHTQRNHLDKINLLEEYKNVLFNGDE